MSNVSRYILRYKLAVLEKYDRLPCRKNAVAYFDMIPAQAQMQAGRS